MLEIASPRPGVLFTGLSTTTGVKTKLSARNKLAGTVVAINQGEAIANVQFSRAGYRSASSDRCVRVPGELVVAP